MKIRRGLIRELIETAILTILIFFAVRVGLQNFRVQGTSMLPTLQNGDFVLVNKVDYMLHSPERGDVIVFHYPYNPSQDYIKRVIGVPGDSIRVDNGTVYVNGKPQSESYIEARPTYTYPAHGSYKVPGGDYFVLGDNRNNSYDSHYWGPVARKYIIGKALIDYWPPRDLKFFSASVRLPLP